MKLFSRLSFCVVVAAAGLTVGVNLNQAGAQQARQPGTEQDLQVLTRGPVHEAFADAIAFNPEPGVIAPKRPPEVIEESPPEKRPTGANVAWIPGYWAWDDELNDFLWISGTWRTVPPGRQWVGGYWTPAQKGYQWVSGYWADDAAKEIEYLPEPPATAETGPDGAAPSADHTWIPGSWIWHQGRYVWRPGVWAPGHQGWTWAPAHYVWSPRGYIFVDGHWDYSVERRGMLFAPVHFRSPVYSQPKYSYSPRTLVNLSAIADHLFVRPRYQHYYFGDYYGANYTAAGYLPSHSYNSSRSGYDPIYASQRWQSRQDDAWEQRRIAQYQQLREQEAARPPRTWEAHQEWFRQRSARDERSYPLGESLDQWSANPENSRRLQSMTNEERRELSQRWQASRQYTTERQKWEASVARGTLDPRLSTIEPGRVPFPRSPYRGIGSRDAGRDYTPPQAYTLPSYDLKVRPTPRGVPNQ